MTQHFEHGEIRGALARQGMSEQDLAWLDSIGWRDAAVPEIASEEEAAAYSRREAALNASIAALLPAERALRLESKLAAALGAALANWRERGESED
jgi:hypothetical protein